MRKPRSATREGARILQTLSGKCRPTASPATRGRSRSLPVQERLERRLQLVQVPHQLLERRALALAGVGLAREREELRAPAAFVAELQEPDQRVRGRVLLGLPAARPEVLAVEGQ